MAPIRYKYTISLSYNYKNTTHIFDKKYIHYVFIDYDYYVNNMPILMAKVNIDKRILADMVKNIETNEIILRIQRHANGDVNESDIINQSFKYVLDNTLKSTELDYNDNDQNALRKDIYVTTTIGLISNPLINNNKVLINEVIVNTPLSVAVLKHTNKMKMLVEPFPNKTIKRLIVPPISTITKFIKFLNNYYTLYDSGYILFYDFNMTYLQSKRGTTIPCIKDVSDTIIFESRNEIVADTYLQGVDRMVEYNADYMLIPYTDIKIYNDRSTDMLYGKVLGIGKDGKTSYKELNNDTTGKVIITRTNKDLNTIANYTYSIDQEKYMVTLVKSDMDTESLTINKPYFIRGYENINPNEKFVLTRKQDVYTGDGDDFVLTTQLVLKKAP